MQTFFLRKSASCTHMSALLHALVAMSPAKFHLQPGLPAINEEDEEALPVTSYPCQWKEPRKRKESTLPMSQAHFEKHVKRKRTVRPVEDFDPRPEKYRGTANNHLPALLDKLNGKGLCISLLLDPRCQYWSNTESVLPAGTPEQPSTSALKSTVVAFKESLKLSPEQIRQIDRDTKDQRHSALWFSVRRYRLTASLFGGVLRRQE